MSALDKVMRIRHQPKAAPSIRMPSDEALDTAIMWLRDNEGDGGEGERCKAVADWLDHEQRERFLRSEARKAGMTVARLRRKLAETASTSHA